MGGNRISACTACIPHSLSCVPLTAAYNIQEVTPRIYHLFQQSPWWHRYAASYQQPQPYFTMLLYRKDVFKPAQSFQLHPFTTSAMGTFPSEYTRGPAVAQVGCLHSAAYYLWVTGFFKLRSMVDSQSTTGILKGMSLLSMPCVCSNHA